MGDCKVLRTDASVYAQLVDLILCPIYEAPLAGPDSQGPPKDSHWSPRVTASLDSFIPNKFFKF